MGLAYSALALAEGLGVARSAMADLIQHSSGRSFGFEVFARLLPFGVRARGGSALQGCEPARCHRAPG
ncbi:hypothetical protein [Novosphingobium panipatense]|uniref:hypothetical protein n=1 Tax=Novosphingobium panipatense TaxID=428991 RepID=UPI00362017C0